MVWTYPSDRGVPRGVGVDREGLTPAGIGASLLVEYGSVSVHNVNVVCVADDIEERVGRAGANYEFLVFPCGAVPAARGIDILVVNVGVVEPERLAIAQWGADRIRIITSNTRFSGPPNRVSYPRFNTRSLT